MIVKKKDAQIREFLGVKFELLAIGEKSMVTKMLYKKHNNVPYHEHPHEQSGYVISGKYRLQFGSYDEILEKGDTYSIPGNTQHTLEILEEGEVIDFFNPPREDYL
ncbi:cupin domain-containing protein [Flavivirga sp. 57AJ16]|uniref:cupin domain-containing protein n=1 Tax=Flavivirga sp. 57AJ16 TaxID=3025307 RepID=UPI002365FF4A|nr:cupin domain-containing protein [Flavivirga sp. 57AJ16]MDD7886190.1 cupin domain-containing protein [Flavivirga sp. 57AJ16]